MLSSVEIRMSKAEVYKNGNFLYGTRFRTEKRTNETALARMQTAFKELLKYAHLTLFGPAIGLLWNPIACWSLTSTIRQDAVPHDIGAGRLLVGEGL